MRQEVVLKLTFQKPLTNANTVERGFFNEMKIHIRATMSSTSNSSLQSKIEHLPERPPKLFIVLNR